MTKNDTIYICSPLSATTEQEMGRNMHAAREYAREVQSELRCRVFAPHAWLPELLDDTVPAERTLALQLGIEILKLCNTLIICHPTVTNGMAKEIAFAQKHGIAIYVRPALGKYFPASCIPQTGVASDWGAWGL